MGRSAKLGTKVCLTTVAAVMISACALFEEGRPGGGPSSWHGVATAPRLAAAVSLPLWTVGERANFLVLPAATAEADGYPLVLEVVLSARPGVELAQVLADDRRRTGERRYVLLTEPFLVTELFLPERRRPARQSFSGSLWRGGEAGSGAGAPLVGEVSVQVRRVVFAGGRRRPPPAGGDGGKEVLLFGDELNLFALPLAPAGAGGSPSPRLSKLRILRGVLDDGEAAALRRGKVATWGPPPSVRRLDQDASGGLVSLRTRLGGNDEVQLTAEVLDEL